MTDKIKFTTGGEIYEMKMDSWQRSNVSPSIELTVERKITDIEQKALALVNKICLEKGVIPYAKLPNIEASEALCRAIEQHEAFRQEVSDTVVVVMNMYPGAIPARHLSRFIISKPKSDPLLDIVERLGGEWKPEEYVKEIRAALEARGLEIREKGK